MTKEIDGIYYMLLKYLNGSIYCLISGMLRVFVRGTTHEENVSTKTTPILRVSTCYRRLRGSPYEVEDSVCPMLC